MADEQITPLRLVTDAFESEQGFRDWLQALLSRALQRAPRRWWLPGELLTLRLEPRFLPGGALPKVITLAHDHRGKNWAVQINLPSTPGDANRLSGIAIDGLGRRWLLRQGFLRRSERKLIDVKGKDFRLATNLLPIEVSIKSAGRREWYPVALLDSSALDICEQTADFVARCAKARLRLGTADTNKNDTAVLQHLLAPAETGGTYEIPAKPATPAKTVDKIQGEVWVAVNDALQTIGKKLDKPLHVAGYGVDGIVIGGDYPLLLEIKSDLTAASVYTGVGQLMVYRKLFTSSASYLAVLLLPGKPNAVLVDAAEQLGIIVEQYTRNPKQVDAIKFSRSFRRLLGLA